MYASFIDICITTYFTLSWLYMNINIIYEYVYEYETSPFIKKFNEKKLTNSSFVYIVQHKCIISIAIVCSVCDGK